MVGGPMLSAGANRAARAVVIDQARSAVSASLNCSSISSAATISCASLAARLRCQIRSKTAGAVRADTERIKRFKSIAAQRSNRRQVEGRAAAHRVFMPADSFDEIRRWGAKRLPIGREFVEV